MPYDKFLQLEGMKSLYLPNKSFVNFHMINFLIHGKSQKSLQHSQVCWHIIIAYSLGDLKENRYYGQTLYGGRYSKIKQYLLF